MRGFLVAAMICLGSRYGSAQTAKPELSLKQIGSPVLFRVEIHNSGSSALVLGIGLELANGTKQSVTAIHYRLTMPDGKTIHPESIEPGPIAGTIDVMTLPLPAGGSFSFLVDLAKYYTFGRDPDLVHIVPGRYSLQATYTGIALMHTNPREQWRSVMPFWTGTVVSKTMEFTVPTP